MYPDYLNGKVEVLGTPKTARIIGKWNGELFRAPIECWIYALVEILTPEQKTQFFPLLNQINRMRELQGEAPADIRANILMPNLKG